MKKISVLLFMLAVWNLTAAEIDIDGKFNNFRRSWSVSSRRHGTVEMVQVRGVNFVQIAADDDPRGSIGIYTARGTAGGRGDTVTVSVDARGGDFEIALNEYSNKKVVGKQRHKIQGSKKLETHKTTFTVNEKSTDLVRVAFNVKKGAAVVVSNVKVEIENKTASTQE